MKQITNPQQEMKEIEVSLKFYVVIYNGGKALTKSPKGQWEIKEFNNNIECNGGHNNGLSKGHYWCGNRDLEKGKNLSNQYTLYLFTMLFEGRCERFLANVMDYLALWLAYELNIFC